MEETSDLQKFEKMKIVFYQYYNIKITNYQLLIAAFLETSLKESREVGVTLH